MTDNMKQYKRKTLNILPDSVNKVLNMENSKLLSKRFGEEILKDFLIVNLSHLYFYYYNSESVLDCGWGCAWRSMQTLLKFQQSISGQNKDKEITFYNLFTNFGSKNFLLDTYKKMKNKNIEILQKTNFAPHENDSGWAEPFISQLISYHFGFEGELILINDYPPKSYAPKEVFDITINFNEFVSFLNEHFSKKNAGPIIIDDATSSICIIGIKYDNESQIMQLLIMDPHCVEKPEDGLYIIILDGEGNQLGTIPDEVKLASMSIFFNQKNWMVFIPHIIDK